MNLPTNGLTFVALVVIALPGLINAAVRRWAQGESDADRNLGLSVARGAIFAIALSSGYLVVAGTVLVETLTASPSVEAALFAHPRRIGLAVVVLYVVTPAAISIVLNRRHLQWDKTPGIPIVRIPRSRHGYSSTPTAWDHAFRQRQSSWVKVKRANGDWIGGWHTLGSYVSSYPEPRTIYIDQQWQMNETGDFTAPLVDHGVYLTIQDADIVIFAGPPNPGMEKGDHS